MGDNGMERRLGSDTHSGRERGIVSTVAHLAHGLNHFVVWVPLALLSVCGRASRTSHFS